MSQLDIQIAVEADGWADETALEALASRVLGAAETHLAASEGQPFPKQPAEVSLVFADDEMIREINAEWRDKDKPTNVLSFPMLTRDELLALPLDGAPVMLGDVALAWETCSHEAVEKEISPQSHAAHLIVHGLLHLSGRDHHDALEADAMEALEIKALASMGFDDPYGTSQA